MLSARMAAILSRGKWVNHILLYDFIWAAGLQVKLGELFNCIYNSFDIYHIPIFLHHKLNMVKFITSHWILAATFTEDRVLIKVV